MKIIKKIVDINKAINNFNNCGFVPTMGGLHNGHISLINNSQKKCKKTIVSIFVNPNQFNNKFDYKKYPRNLKNDIKILKNLKVDYLFIPNTKEIYKYRDKKFTLKNNDKVLCAKFRKGHFEGVLDIMNRFLKIIKVKKVFMGEKDYQQLFLVKKYLCKKHKFKVINCSTVRDKNKVALSTRNSLLNKKNYLTVHLITKYLFNLKKTLIANKKNLNQKLIIITNNLENLYKIKIDYLEIRSEKKLSINFLKGKLRLFIAYKINKIRLIDNF
tara:strand:+ start:1965 stop:2777 length:813 start_codon:yes stop_codon:yes gene_type:complete